MAAGWRIFLALLLASATRCGAGLGCGFIRAPASLLGESLRCRAVDVAPFRDPVASPVLSGISMKRSRSNEQEDTPQYHTMSDLESRLGVKFNDM